MDNKTQDKPRDIFKNVLVQGNRILVKPAPQSNKTKGGIMLPANSQIAHHRAEVVAMGDKCVNIKNTQVGDIIIYNSNSGAPIQIEDTTYYIILDHEPWLTEIKK